MRTAKTVRRNCPMIRIRSETYAEEYGRAIRTLRPDGKDYFLTDHLNATRYRAAAYSRLMRIRCQTVYLYEEKTGVTTAHVKITRQL